MERLHAISDRKQSLAAWYKRVCDRRITARSLCRSHFLTLLFCCFDGLRYWSLGFLLGLPAAIVPVIRKSYQLD